jgi:imidazolonepropionase-like amidohydrolase
MTTRYLIQAGRLIDGTGADPVDNTDVLIEEGAIAAVGPRGTLSADGAEVVDATAQTLLPGLIDAHVHLCSDPEPRPLATRMQESVAMKTIRGVRNARLTVEGGITAIRALGTDADQDLAIRDAIEAGLIPGPRIVAGGRGITSTGGHGHYHRIEADGVDEVRKATRERVKRGVDVIKLAVTGGVMTPGIRPGVPKMNKDEIEAAVQEAHKAGIKVAGHAEGRVGVNDAIAAGIDSIEHGYFMNNPEGIALMLAHGTYLVPTIMAYVLIAEGAGSDLTDEAIENAEMALEYNTVGFREALDAGVKIAMGSDAGTAFNDHGRSWRELGYMVQHGMTPMEAIMSATSNAAELLGLADQVGTVAVGKRADLILVDGDPLAEISEIGRIRAVFKDGERIIRNGS